jgi:soluble cytochrome b562
VNNGHHKDLLNHHQYFFMRIWQFLCGGLLVLNMTSCAKKPASIETATTTPANSTTSTTKDAPAKSSGFIALQGVIGATKKAIESGKLDAAKTEFAKFEASWKTVEDGIKTKSPESYRAIEDSVRSVETGIDSKKSKEALIASLQKLSQSVDKASK